MPYTKNQRKEAENKIYFADWNPDELEGNILPLTKVGMSSNPERRINEYTLPPFGVEIVAIIRPEFGEGDNLIAEQVESELHRVFTEMGYNVNGEWFSLPDEVIGWAERNKKITVDDVENANWR